MKKSNVKDKKSDYYQSSLKWEKGDKNESVFYLILTIYLFLLTDSKFIQFSISITLINHQNYILVSFFIIQFYPKPSSNNLSSYTQFKTKNTQQLHFSLIINMKSPTSEAFQKKPFGSIESDCKSPQNLLSPSRESPGSVGLLKKLLGSRGRILSR